MSPDQAMEPTGLSGSPMHSPRLIGVGIGIGIEGNHMGMPRFRG